MLIGGFFINTTYFAEPLSVSIISHGLEQRNMILFEVDKPIIIYKHAQRAYAVWELRKLDDLGLLYPTILTYIERFQIKKLFIIDEEVNISRYLFTS